MNIFRKLDFLPYKINGSFMTSENRERYSWEFLVFPILWHKLYSLLSLAKQLDSKNEVAFLKFIE